MHNQDKKPIKGIRIRTVNFLMIGISCILYLLLISATVNVSKQYENVHKSMDDYIICERSDTLLLEGSAYLTEQVRLYTITGKPEYMEQYFTEVHETRRREKAMEQLKVYYDGEKAYEYLAAALDYSNQLMEREFYVMRLVSDAQGYEMDTLPEEIQKVILEEDDRQLNAEGLMERATEIVYSSEYEYARARITESITDSIESMHEVTHDRMIRNANALELTMKIQRGLMSILFVETVVTFLMIILLIIKPLRIYVNCIKEEKQMEITGSYEFKYLALTYNDIYELNAANEEMLRYRAEHDPMTGIMNRGAFENLKKLMEVKAIPLAFLIIDVDKFKLVNDNFGHEVGDLVLKKVAKLLQESFRATDYPARIGGDEFAVILTDMTVEMQPVIEGKIQKMNEILMNPEDGLPQVSLSVGGAFSEKGFTEDLYKRADVALYEVKEHGRCGCRFCQEN